jgi:hypothetical protein
MKAASAVLTIVAMIGLAGQSVKSSPAPMFRPVGNLGNLPNTPYQRNTPNPNQPNNLNNPRNPQVNKGKA